MSMEWIKDHRSTILTVASAVGVVATGIMAARSQMKVDQILMDEEKPAKKKIVKAYAPAVAVGAATVGVIIASAVTSSEEKKKLTKLLLATEASFTAYRNYVRNVDEELDAKAMEVAKERVKVIERVEVKEVPNKITIVEPFTKMEFTIDEVDFWCGLNETNKFLAQHGYAEYGDFLDNIGYFRIEGTEDLFWDMEYLCEELGCVYIDADLYPRPDGKYDIGFEMAPSLAQKENACLTNNIL